MACAIPFPCDGDRTVEFQQIRYFLALADAMNFTQAAKRCGVSQPTLTRAIKNLETELGGPLVRRERGRACAEGPFARERSGAGGVDAAVPRVRCGACRHFRRRDSHPHLGDCAGGVPRTAAGGFWDDQVRGCGAFMPRRP